MNLFCHAENRSGQDPQIFSCRSNPDFSNACGRLGKIQFRRAAGKNLSGSNRRTVFSRAKATCKTANHLHPNLKPDNHQKPLTHCPFFRSKPSGERDRERGTFVWGFMGSLDLQELDAHCAHEHDAPWVSSPLSPPSGERDRERGNVCSGVHGQGCVRSSVHGRFLSRVRFTEWGSYKRRFMEMFLRRTSSFLSSF